MDENLRKSFLFNFIVVLLLCTGLYILFFASLGLITRHSSEVRVPNVTGKDLKTAFSSLEKMGFEVDVDSSYDPKLKPYVVLSQIPTVGSIVKEGRTLFLTVNKAEPPMTPMPKLLDLSYRSALMILKNSRLTLGDTLHKPDYAKEAVLQQLYNGRPIGPGDMLPQGSKIDLVIGDGFGNVDMNVPDVIGMKAYEGIDDISGNNLTPTIIWDGPIDDSASAIIYSESPAPYNELNAHNRIRAGDVIDIRIKQNPTDEELEGNRRPGSAVNKEETKEEPKVDEP
jgi:beta-lactam-binding protein with PASTA domain